ncbi:hypothetical protein IRX47_005055 [Salmonella enterica]|nr:hypothetical protein [Salmonella enterica]EGM6484855.1 hypothetical protein [Salmonella enterica]EGN5159684.1 hypothetical protein [Salmonella enterica]EKH9051314.1 hypothetical protein [Salmonella enterica]
MRQELEDKIVYLSSLSFDNTNPLENRNSYYGDVMSDMFIASIISNLDKATALRVVEDMRKLVDISAMSTRTGLSGYPVYTRHRLNGISLMAETLRTSHEQDDQ